MFCPQCGHNVPAGAAHCPQCGTAMVQRGQGSKIGNPTLQQKLQNRIKSVGSKKTQPPLGQGFSAAGYVTPTSRAQKKIPTKLIAGVAAVLVLVLAGFTVSRFLGGRSSSQTQTQAPRSTGKSVGMSQDVQDALKESSDYSAQLAKLLDEERHEEYFSILDQAINAFDNTQQIISFEVESTSEETRIALERYEQTIENAQAVAMFERQLNEAQHVLSGNSSAEEQYSAVEIFQEDLASMEIPAGAEQVIENWQSSLEVYKQALNYDYASGGNAGTVGGMISSELYDWWHVRQDQLYQELNDLWVRQYEETAQYIDKSSATVDSKDAVADIECTIIDSIYPNLYPSLDSAVNLYVTALDDQQSISVEVKLPNFARTFKQTYELNQGVNYIQIKPATLSMNEIRDLDKTTTIQASVRVVNLNTQQRLMQESKNIEKFSIYDARWHSDEFGFAEQLNILAWLRPESSEVSAVIREASDILEGWTGVSSMAGDQLGETFTLVQIAAIQQAISNRGVTYTMDNYSFAADQRILTPDEVLSQKHGLCIETSLLMASCLQQMDLDVYLIFPQGHAQVGVALPESGLIVIETTILPFDPNTALTKKNDDIVPVTGQYFFRLTDNPSDAPEYIIPCDLAKVMDIRGLDVS